MKTKPSVRRKWRRALLCLTIAVLALIEFGVCESVAARIGQVTAVRSETPQAPPVSLSEVMAAMR